MSHTTRGPRPGEVDGRDYHFVDRQRFETLRHQGAFLEWAEVGGELYGTAATTVGEAAGEGLDVLLDVDTQGAASIRRLIPEAILIFIMPPNREALRERLEGRGTEPAEARARRLDLARGEIRKASTYDYVVVNDDLDTAYDRLRAIVLSVRCRRNRQAARVRDVAADFGISNPEEG